MSFSDNDFLRAVKMGEIEGHMLVHKFGKNDAVTPSPEPIAVGGNYQMPTANVMLEFVSDDADDTAAGAGAREMTVQGVYFLDGLLVPQSEVIATNGTTAVPLTKPFARTFRAKVTGSGTYTTQAALSSSGTLTIREVGGGSVWLQIGLFGASFSAGQSQVALYTTASGSKSVLYSPYFTIEANKDVSIYMLNREGADVIDPPYSSGRLVQEWVGLQGAGGIEPFMPVAVFNGATDIGFMASVDVGTAKVSAGFWLLEIEAGYW